MADRPQSSEELDTDGYIAAVDAAKAAQFALSTDPDGPTPLYAGICAYLDTVTAKQLAAIARVRRGAGLDA